MHNHKTQYVAPIEYFRMKAKSLRFQMPLLTSFIAELET